ncbi:hypothetical protein [Desmospora profundinema]|uniref:Uncharacterized protein Usg n=1 Tax=Desmospora profundinema TaxID=1571184 RepID=A0ABU1IRN8_9BACL|nr:hypothetical protein [Desmospora profundinema]MDR6227415.1 uncharacterized protein Usg [Desmospora profundinema]
MERKSWAVQIGGSHHIVNMEYGSGIGLIRIDGELVERWKGKEGRDCHRVFELKGRCCGLHMRYDDRREEYEYDLSLNGFSIMNGKDVSPFSSTPSEGITKRWILRLADGIHTLLYQHIPYERRTIYLDGRLVEDSRFYQEEDSDHLLLFKGHRIGIHLSRVDKEYFCYDLSIDGVSPETGKRIGMIPPTPSECRKKVWFISLEGVTHTVVLEHQGMNHEKKLVVDGKLLVQSGFAPNQKDIQHPFFLGNHRCALSIRRQSKWMYRYDLLVNGVSVDTGETLDYKPAVSSSGGGKRIWRVHLDGLSHTVLVEHRSTKATIWVDDTQVGEKNFWKESKDSFFSFQIGENPCALIVHRGDDGEYTYHLYVNGLSLDTGEPLYPLKIQGRDVWWQLELEGRVCTIRLEHQRLSDKRRLFLDDQPLTEQRWKVGAKGSIHAIRMERHWVVVEVREEEDHFSYHLYVNGQRVEPGCSVRMKPMNMVEEVAFLKKLKRQRGVESERNRWKKRIVGAISTYVSGLLLLIITHYMVGSLWLGWTQPQPFSWYLFIPVGLTSLPLSHAFETRRWIRIVVIGCGTLLIAIGLMLSLWD